MSDPATSLPPSSLRPALRTSLTKKIGFLLFLFWVGAVGALVLVYGVVDATRHDTHFVNVAGRQRMLAQQLMFHAGMSMVGRDDDRRALKDTVVEFEHAQAALELGGPVQGDVLPPARGEVKRSLQRVRAAWQRIKPRLRLEPDAPIGDPTRLEKFLEREIPKLTDEAAAVVTAYERDSDLRRERALTGVAAIAVVELLLFMLGMWATRQFIAKPILALEEVMDRIRDGDFSRHVHLRSKDELGEAAEHLNAMNDRVSQVLTAERRRLHDAEDNLRHLLESAPVGLFGVDGEGVVTRVVGRCVHARGLRLGQYRGKSVLEDFDRAPWLPRQLRRALGGDAFVGGGEVDGLHLEVRYEPISSADGEVTGCVCVCTERARHPSPMPPPPSVQLGSSEL